MVPRAARLQTGTPVTSGEDLVIRPVDVATAIQIGEGVIRAIVCREVVEVGEIEIARFIAPPESQRRLEPYRDIAGMLPYEMVQPHPTKVLCHRRRRYAWPTL